MDLEQYLKLDRILPAFRFRDVQSAVTVYTWIQAHGYNLDDLRDYTAIHPHVEGIHNSGYFSLLDGDVEHAKRVKAWEKTLPKDARAILRKERMHRLAVMPTVKKPCGCQKKQRPAEVEGVLR